MESMWPSLLFPSSSTLSTATATTASSHRSSVTSSPEVPGHGSTGGVAFAAAAAATAAAALTNHVALVDERIRRATAIGPDLENLQLRSLLSSPKTRVASWALMKVSSSVPQVHQEIRSLCAAQVTLADASFRSRAVAAYLGLRCVTQIADATIAPHPDIVFALLCVYAALTDLFGFALSVFFPILEQLSVDSRSSFSVRLDRTLLVLRSTIRCSLEDLGKRILCYPSSKQLRPAGCCGVDEITEYLTRYIKLLLEHSGLLSAIVGSDKPEKEGASLKDAVAGLITNLEAAIEKKSMLFTASDGSQWLFLVNNAHHILKQAESSGMKPLLGDNWILQRREQLETYISSYIDVAWVPILSCLQSEARCKIKSCFNTPTLPTFRRFNLEFEQTCNSQKSRKVEDPQLRKSMRGAVAEKIVPAYRSFLEKRRRRPPKYIKYTPEEIEEHLSELYEG